ncbi:polymer-forming cytoskeletal protein [Pontiella sp.]|uniref:polymer-forming cytoskeletal protein n=1 Tax=Pontiella sp. TaxID=2837462 RepID=UPI003564F611
MQLKPILLGLFATLAVHAQAMQFVSTNFHQSAEGQIVADEQWVTADLIKLDGVHKNDLFLLAGNSIALSGTFEGNVWGAGGQNAYLGGYCERSLRLAGQSVRIDGEVGGNVLALAETVIFGTNSLVHGSVKVFAHTIVHEGAIEGNADFSSARMLTFGGTIEGNTKVVSPDILFTRSARLKGDLTYTANKELVPVEGVVAGKLARQLPQSPPLFSAARFSTLALWFAAALLAGIPFITVFPMTTAIATQLVRSSPWKCMLVGFVSFWGLLIFGIAGISSVIGLPLGVLLLAAWGALAYLSHIVVGLVFGALLLRSMRESIGKVILALSIGLAFLYLVAVIPSPLFLFHQVVAWFGMGALILSFVEKRHLMIQLPNSLKKLEELRDEKLTPEEK